MARAWVHANVRLIRRRQVYKPTLWLEQLEDRGALSVTPLVTEILPVTPPTGPAYVLLASVKSNQPTIELQPMTGDLTLTQVQATGAYVTFEPLTLQQSTSTSPIANLENDAPITAWQVALAHYPDTSLVPGHLPPKGDPGSATEQDSQVEATPFRVALRIEPVSSASTPPLPLGVTTTCIQARGPKASAPVLRADHWADPLQAKSFAPFDTIL